MIKRKLSTLPEFIKEQIEELRKETPCLIQSEFKVYSDHGIEVQLVITRDRSEFLGTESLFNKGEK